MLAGKKRILVADDNSALAAVIRFNLQQARFDVTVARNGREAWQHLQSDPFDLLITDQQMPELSGCELCEKIRKDPRLAKLPIVMLTAKGLELEFSQLRDELGISALLGKPFSPREVIQTVETCLGVGLMPVGSA